MNSFTLTGGERASLEDLAAHADTPEQLRRALALLWLDDGEEPPEVADRLLVTRQTVYNWAARFRARGGCGLDVAARVADAPRDGRPPAAEGLVDGLLDAVIDTDPRDFGYRSTVWTAPLLARYLSEAHHVQVSERSVSLALARLRIRWKRPRHALSRRPPTWRQSKGGSRPGCGTGSGRSC